VGAAIVIAGAVAIVGPARLIAQIEGERGIIPMARSTDIEVSGIEVNVTGKNGQDARENGWKEAYKKAWAQLKGPNMPESAIEGMVSAVVIEREQIGPRRYIAKLTVSFDRGKAGQFVGGKDGVVAAHSAPLLVIPVLYSGGVAQVFIWCSRCDHAYCPAGASMARRTGARHFHGAVRARQHIARNFQHDSP